MNEMEVKATFKTITPLWTGDTWQECKEIRPSSLIGSLRFWFETLMYFGGVLKEEQFNKALGRFEKEVDREKLKDFMKHNGNNLSDILTHLDTNQKIPLPSMIFGTTNWKSFIRIKNVDFDKNKFSNKPTGRIILNKNWFWSKTNYQGELKIIFSVREEILESVFYPLLTFMDKYGYWGGKWSIGYGRLRVEKIEIKNENTTGYEENKEWQKKEFNLAHFGLFTFKLENGENPLIKRVINFNELLNQEKIVKILDSCARNNDLKEVIEELIKQKSQERKNITDQKDRHYKFGKTGRIEGEDLPQGSKILPFIEEDNGQYKGGFLSITGLLNLENSAQGDKNG